MCNEVGRIGSIGDEELIVCMGTLEIFRQRKVFTEPKIYNYSVTITDSAKCL